MAAFRTRTLIAFVATAALAVTVPAHTRADETLDLRVSPRIAREPATLTVNVIVERHPENRALQIRVESHDYYRSSLIQLDGDEAPRSTRSDFKDIPGGHHIVQAVLLGPGGKPRASASYVVEVLGKQGDS